MADTCNDAIKRLTGVTHNAAAINSPMSANYQETVDFGEHRPGSRISPASWVKSYSCRASVTNAEFGAPVVRGTSGSLVLTCEQIDGTSIAITITNMLAGAANADIPHNDVATQTQEFVYNAGNSEDYAPISVS